MVNLLSIPENRAAGDACRRVLADLTQRSARRAHNPLFVHGPPGCGKSHLLRDLVAGFTRDVPTGVVAVLAAADLDGRDAEEPPAALLQADLVVVEDVQKTPARAVETFVTVIDRCLARGKQLVLSATRGPGLLELPHRLTSRLAQGLVVQVEGLSLDSRRAVLRLRRPDLADDVLDWLARHAATSFRQVEGVCTRLAQLETSRLEDVIAAFAEDQEARRPTLERIAQRVSRYYRVDQEEMRARGRTRETMLPRQVGMYLARQLTGLPLVQIGAYFGGRDHSTVLHACRKVAEALDSDASLSGAVRELHAELG